MGLLLSGAAAGAVAAEPGVTPGESAQGPVMCVPDATGTGWVCGDARSLPPPPPQPRRPAPSDVTDATASGTPHAEPPADPPLDPLTGLSNRPDDWYTPTPPRPADQAHTLDRDLAAAYYVTAADDSGVCPGGYQVRTYPHPVGADNASFPVVAEADSLSSVLDESALLAGNVTIEQGNRQILAPSARVDQQARTASFERGVRMDQPGMVMQGDTATVNLDDKEARLEGVQFVLTGPQIRGTAETLHQSPDGDLKLGENQFTRCKPGNNGWRLNTGQLVIEEDAVFGTAKNAVLRMKSVPVFYSPYLQFPVSDERLSGFLFPNLGYSDEDGVDASIPYYFNLAPNYDATLVPRYLSQRGAGGELELRHMSTWQTTVLSGAMLPDDDLYNGILDRDDYDELGGEPVFGPFEPADRWLGAVDHQGVVGPFRTLIDYTSVSDRDYFRDLGSDLGVSSRSELERKGEVSYNRGGFFARLWAQRFQRLDEVRIEDYQRLPELEMSWTTGVAGPFEFSLGAEWAEFDRDTDGLSGLNALTGSRTHVEPRLRMPLSWPFGFFSMGAGYRYTEYDLQQSSQVTTPLADDNPDRGIGVGTVDGGLFFERELNWFNQDLVQTLEPRVYYLWQDYDAQDHLPRFDASELTFSYSQLFRDNRFSGLDRIGDAKQVSVGVTTRFLSQATGREYFRFALGEIHYLLDRRVTLNGVLTPEQTQSSSAIASEMSALLAGNWRLTGNLIWDPHDNQVDEGGAALQYRRDNRHIINLGFRNRVESDIEQTDLSLYWPITDHIAVLGRWNHDLVSGRTIEGFGGLEYSDCCLMVRLIARRFLDSNANDFEMVEADDGIFLQIVFKGLAGFGTQVESVLERGIRGYRSPQQRDYLTNR